MQIIIKTYVFRRNEADCYRSICLSIERRILLLEHLLPTARRRSLLDHMFANSATQIVIETAGRRQRDVDRY